MFEIVLLVLLGAVLIFLETILVGGFWCVVGLGLCSWAVWLSYEQYGLVASLACGVVSVVAAVGAFLVWLYVLPKTRFGKEIYLSTVQDGKASKGDLSVLVGKVGVAESMLMPSGKVQIDGFLYDARAQFQHIDSGSKVEVVQTDSFGLVVKQI